MILHLARYLLVACCFCFNSVIAQTQLSKSQIDSITNIIAREMAIQHIPGLSIAISIDTTIVWGNAYGMSDIENSVPMTTNTKLRSASIGKPMTATAIMQLYQKGVINLNDSIQKYYPLFPTKRWPISIYQLLTHQSGIRPYQDEEVINHRHYKNVCEALTIFENDTLLFKPGTNYSYTSFNYNLLGCILQKASKTDYYTFMYKSIFESSKMDATVLDDVNLVIHNRANGYRYDSQNKMLENSYFHDPSDRIPAGGFLTTPIDLVKFAIAFYSCKLISQKIFSEMILNPKLPNGRFSGYGIGWGLFEPNDKFHGYTEVYHGGQTPGVSNMLVLFLSPDKKVSIAIMTNLEGVQRRQEICEKIFEVIIDIK